MIVDSSAIAAIVFDEPDGPCYALALTRAERPVMSAANWFQATIVVDTRGTAAISRGFDDFIADTGIVVQAVTAEHARIARRAYRDYGKGSGHPAQLNFGDCFSYALAADLREPKLVKGDDFVHTDLTLAELPDS